MVNHVYPITRQPEFAKDFALTNQITRAAGSVMHNIAEGFDAGTDRQFLQFLGYARRSASEVQSQLYTALDQGYIDQEQFETIYTPATRTKLIINGLIRYLSSSSKNSVREEGIDYQIFFGNDESNDLDHYDDK